MTVVKNKFNLKDVQITQQSIQSEYEKNLDLANENIDTFVWDKSEKDKRLNLRISVFKLECQKIAKSIYSKLFRTTIPKKKVSISSTIKK
jgi:hypothetical protein